MSMSGGLDTAGRGRFLVRRPVVACAVAAMVAVVAVVAVVVVMVPAMPVSAQAPAIPPAADPAPLYGRWVRSPYPCDTPRGDMVVTASSIVHHEGGVIRSNMKLANVAVKSPGVFEVKYTSQDGTFVAFSPFELKDAETLQVSGYLFQSDGVWRKC